MRIRKAKLSDAAELSRLHKGTIRSINKADYSPSQIEAWSKRTNAQRFRRSHDLAVRYVAVEGDTIIGYVDFKKENPEQFWGLYVHKNHLGKGVGSKLLAKMEELAKKMGASKFRLESTKTAQTFYEKHGFKVVEKAKHQIEDQKLEIYIMEKKL
jgi:putative acetyltransferase